MSTDLVPDRQYVQAYWRNAGSALFKFSSGSAFIGVLFGVFGSGGVGAMFALPVIFGAFGALIGRMFVPEQPAFRSMVLEHLSEQSENDEATHLLGHVSANHKAIYQSMASKMSQVEDLILNRRGVILGSTWDMLKSTPLNYLRMAYTSAQYNTQGGALEKDIHREIQNLEVQISNSEGTEKRRYVAARNQLKEVLERRRSMESRGAVVNARLIAMKNDFDEVCTLLVKNPTMGIEGEIIRDLISRFDVEEEMNLFSNPEEELEAQFEGLFDDSDELYESDEDLDGLNESNVVPLDSRSVDFEKKYFTYGK